MFVRCLSLCSVSCAPPAPFTPLSTSAKMGGHRWWLHYLQTPAVTRLFDFNPSARDSARESPWWVAKAPIWRPRKLCTLVRCLDAAWDSISNQWFDLYASLHAIHRRLPPGQCFVFLFFFFLPLLSLQEFSSRRAPSSSLKLSIFSADPV